MMRTVLGFFGRYPFFLPWRAHLAIVIALLFWRGDHTGAVSWIGAVIVLRVILFYSWCCWWMVRASARLVWSAWCRFAFALFGFLPLQSAEAEAEERNAMLAHKHPLVKSVVMIEGLICAGKTTACAALRRCPATTVRDEAVPHDVLARFNESHDGTEIQMVMGERRRKQLAESVIIVNLQHHAVVHDRSLIGCRAFALWNYVAGTLSHEALMSYLALAKSTVGEDFAAFRAPVRVLYMPIPVWRALARLRKRAGPDQSTSERYMLGVSMMHALVICSLLAARRRHVKVQLYVPPAAPFDIGAGCMCAVTRTASSDWEEVRGINLLEYTGLLGFEDDAEHERLRFVKTELLQLSPEMLDYTERAWTTTLFEAIAAAAQQE